MRTLALALLLSAVSGAGAQEHAAWSMLREGRAVLILRHATAPGYADPPGFVLEDCATQRNLDEAGRSEAKRWGDLLRQNGVSSPRILSSRWCRALETARRMALAPVEPVAVLDSFFDRPGQGATQTAALRRLINSLPPEPPVVLVTHQVNITALTGVFPRSGEGIVLALPVNDPPHVLARIAPP